MSETSKLYLTDVADIVTGSTPITSNMSYWNGSIPFYSPVDFDGKTFCKTPEKFVTELGAKTGRLIPSGAIMVTCIGSIGKIAICGISGITNQQINTLITKPNFDVSYVYYLVLNNVNKLKQFAPQTTIPILNKTDFGKFQFNFHQYPQQIQISKILRCIDQAIEKTEALIEKYQHIKAGLMHDLFTRGIGADGKLRPPREQAPELYQQTPIGWIPKSWNFSNLGKLYREPARNGLYKPAHFHGRGLPMIQMGNMFKGMYVSFESVGRVFVTNSELKTFGLLKGDLLFGRRSLVLEGAGKCALVEDLIEPSTFESSIIRVRLEQDLIQSLFASYFFSSEIAYLNRRKFIRQVAVSGISGADLKEFSIPLPQLEEQTEISNRLLCIDSNLDVTNKNLQKLNMQKSGLMHDLLTGKVQVTINSTKAAHV